MVKSETRFCLLFAPSTSIIHSAFTNPILQLSVYFGSKDTVSSLCKSVLRANGNETPGPRASGKCVAAGLKWKVEWLLLATTAFDL